jgi:hypothetical protein
VSVPESSLASALVAAQAAMPTVKKDEENPHFKSRFVSLNGLIDATRPKLNEHGLAIVQFPTVSELGAPVLRTILIHGATGERLEADTPLLVAGDGSMQQLGSAITYARRYAWAAVLGIAAEEDDDGNSAGPKPKPKTPAKPKAKLISQDQRSRMWAIAKANNVAQTRLRGIVKEVAGVDSTTEIPLDKYEEIVKQLGPAKPAVTGEGEQARKVRLQRRLTTLCDKAETDAKMLLPEGQDSWDGYAHWLAQTQYGVTLEELKVDELAALTDEIQEQMVPF